MDGYTKSKAVAFDDDGDDGSVLATPQQPFISAKRKKTNSLCMLIHG